MVSKCANCPARTYIANISHYVATCFPQQSCGKGTKYYEGPLRDAVRSCNACPDSTFRADEGHFEPVCEPWTACGDVTVKYESVAPTATADRICAYHGTCTSHQYESAAPTATSARECRQTRAACEPGTYVDAL